MTGQEIKEHIGENKGSTYSGLLLGEISLDPTMCSGQSMVDSH